MAVNLVSASSMNLNLTSSLSSFQNLTGGTMMCWVSLQGTLPTSEVHLINFSVGTSPNSGRFAITYQGGSTKFRTSARRLDANSVSSINGTTSPTIGTIYHVCATAAYNGTALKIYVNGVQEGTLTVAGWTGSSSNTASQSAKIGSAATIPGTYVNAHITDVRTYNRVLTANEIEIIYNARGGDSVVNGMLDRWKLMDGANASVIGTARSIGSLQGGAVAVNSPTYVENLRVVTHRRRGAGKK